jgi:hypothetical protein
MDAVSMDAVSPAPGRPGASSGDARPGHAWSGNACTGRQSGGGGRTHALSRTLAMLRPACRSPPSTSIQRGDPARRCRGDHGRSAGDNPAATRHQRPDRHHRGGGRRYDHQHEHCNPEDDAPPPAAVGGQRLDQPHPGRVGREHPDRCNSIVEFHDVQHPTIHGRSNLWGSRSRPVPVTCMIDTFGR